MRLGSLLLGRQAAGDRPGDQLDGHQAGLLAGLLASHAVGHDEQVRGLERQRGHLAVALRAAVVPDRPPAGDVEVVFVMLPVVSPHRDNADSQFELARQERKRRERGELLGRRVVAVGVPLAKKRLFIQLRQSRKPAHLEIHPSRIEQTDRLIVPSACFPRMPLTGVENRAEDRPATSLSPTWLPRFP